MKQYQVKFKEISLKEAVEQMDKSQIYYNYEIGKALFQLDRESLPSAIKNDAKFLTPSSWLTFE